jgi:hypothetical protein
MHLFPEPLARRWHVLGIQLSELLRHGVIDHLMTLNFIDTINLFAKINS